MLPVVCALLCSPSVPIAQDEPVLRGEVGVAMDEYLTRLEAFGFSGAVLFADRDGIALAQGYGLADREAGRPVTVDTVFTTGSITKQFTAAAILKLEEEGELSVDDSIADHFDDVPADKRGITLHNLLTHTAGLRSDFAATDFTPVERDEYVRRALASELVAPPGEEYHYANSGFSLLGAIVEQVSGVSYEGYLRENLFLPAGMKDTGYLLPKWDPSRIAVGYREGERWGTIVERPMAEDGPFWALRANGGVHSTIGDMYRWHEALVGDALLSEESKAMLYDTHVPEGPRARSYYGYGWSIVPAPRFLATHNGGNGIFAADFVRYLEDGVTLYLSSNNADLGAIAISPDLRRLAFAEDVELPPELVAMPAGELERYAGVYALPSGASIEVRRNGDALDVICDNAEAYGAVIAQPGPGASRVKACAGRSEELIRSAVAGDYAPVAAAFGGGMELEEVAAREAGLWNDLARELGAFRSVGALGGRAAPGGARVELRLDFEKGARFLRHAWEDGHLVGIRLSENAPRKTLRPSSATTFVHFEARRGSVSSLAFTLDADGRPIGIPLRTRAGLVTAKKR